MPMPLPQAPTAPEDVLASFFGGRTESDPLTLAKLRGQRISEAQNRLVADTRAGDGRDAGGTTALLKMLQGEADTDPDTGVEARGRQQKMEDAATAIGPGPIGDLNRHNEAVAIQRDLAQHPSPNVSPFDNGPIVPNVSGGVPSNMKPGSGPATLSRNAAPGNVDADRFAAATRDLSPDAAAKVAALLQYDLPIPSGNVLTRPEYSVILGRAMQIDPTFDYKNYDARKAYLQDFAKGKTGQGVQALDTVMHHLDNFDQAATGLHNSGFKPYNAAANWFTSNTIGNPAVGKFEEAANAVSGELSNVFKATGATDHEIASWRDHLSTSATPEEFKARVQELTGLIGGRMDAVGKHYQDVMGKPSPDFLSPESRGIWQRFQSGGAAHNGSVGPQVGESRVVNGVRYTWDGHGWGQ